MEKIKEVIRQNLKNHDCGLFYVPNNTGDYTYTIYVDDEKDIRVDVCGEYQYFEVFGLNIHQQEELTNFYNKIRGCY